MQKQDDSGAGGVMFESVDFPETACSGFGIWGLTLLPLFWMWVAGWWVRVVVYVSIMWWMEGTKLAEGKFVVSREQQQQQ